MAGKRLGCARVAAGSMVPRTTDYGLLGTARCSPFTRPEPARSCRRKAPRQDHRSGGLDRSPQSHARRKRQDRAGAEARRAHSRGAAGDRGVEPALSGGRRAFHDGDDPVSGRHGRAHDDAGHLHPMAAAAHHRALCRAPRILDLRRALLRPEVKITSGTIVLIGLIETHRSIAWRISSSACKAEVEHAVALDLRDEGRIASRQRRFDVLLEAIGREGEITSTVRERARTRWGVCSPFLLHARNERKG